jgi:hypothetical protein
MTPEIGGIANEDVDVAGRSLEDGRHSHHGQAEVFPLAGLTVDSGS